METHEQTECCNCGVLIFMTAERLRRLKETGDMFYCLNGHGQHFTKTTTQILRERLSEKEKKISELERENAVLKRPKRTYTKRKK